MFWLDFRPPFNSMSGFDISMGPTFDTTMGTNPVHDSQQAPSGSSCPALLPRPSPLICGDISAISDTESKTHKKFHFPRRKTEQACDSCRKREVKCDGREPSCASCQGRQSECSFAKILRRKKRKEKEGDLDQMAERISRMERMLRQRGFLQDEQGKYVHKTELKGADIESVIEELGRDVSVPSLCGTGMDSTIRTGFTPTGTGTATMDPPPVPDKERVLGRVEMWLRGLPPLGAGGSISSAVGEERTGDIGYGK